MLSDLHRHPVTMARHLLLETGCDGLLQRMLLETHERAGRVHAPRPDRLLMRRKIGSPV